MGRKQRPTRKQKQRKTPNWKGKSAYALKQQQKRERAASEIGLPISSSWADINKERRDKEEEEQWKIR